MPIELIVLYAKQRRDCDRRLSSATRLLVTSDEAIQRVRRHLIDSRQKIAAGDRRLRRSLDSHDTP